MAKYQNDKLLEGLTLGKATEYSYKYNPKLLQGVPRSLNRDDLALTNDALTFFGEDVWYGYEVSWLNKKGKPVVAVAEFIFPCTSAQLIESKSFKLYLNSFNQSQFSSSDEVKNILASDLSTVAQAEVEVNLFAVDDCPPLLINMPSAQCIDKLDINITHYDYDASLLSQAQNSQSDAQAPTVTEVLVSHLLKSNCLITNQPDWASVFISYTGKAINHEALLRYIISFRQHNEFHEQCVERIYCDIQHYCDVESLTVYARYTRRGGLDINPYRSSFDNKAPKCRTIRQ